MKLCWVLVGDNEFLAKEAIANLQKQVEDRTDVDPSTPLSELLVQMSTVSMFSKTTLWVLHQPAWLSASLSDKDVDTLVQWLESLATSPDKVVVWASGSFDSRKTSVKTLKKYAELIECNTLKEWEQAKAVAWIETKARSTGFSLDPEAADMLVALNGLHFGVLHNELEKLQLFKKTPGRITLADVDALSGQSATTLFNFTESIKKWDRQGILEALSRLFETGEDSVKLLGVMIYQLRFFLEIQVLLNEKKSVDDIAKQLGRHPFVIKQSVTLAKKKSVESLKQALGVCHDTDVAIKSGKLQPKIALELAIGQVF